MGQVFRISHADLYRQSQKGVTVPVPIGTRSIRLMATAAAVPVEVWGDMQPPDARAQDGQVFHVPGDTLYPGDQLILRDGVTTLCVRLPPSMNGGASAWLNVLNLFAPFGEDASRGLKYGNNPPSEGDLGDGPFPTNDGAVASIKDAQLVFSAERDVQLRAGVSLGTFPNTMRLPATYQTTGTRPNLVDRCSVQNSLESYTGTSNVRLVSPWHIAPQGLLSRFQRARLRVGVAQAWKAGQTMHHAGYLSCTQGFAPTLMQLNRLAMGAVRPLLDNGRQYQGSGSTEVTIDVGSPAELFSIMAPNIDTTFAVLGQSRNWTYLPKVWGEWLFDNGQSRPGHMEARAVHILDVDAGALHGVFCASPRGKNSVVCNLANAGTGGELRAWQVDHSADCDTTTTPAFTVPLVAGAQTACTLPVGNWYVAVYGGSGANVSGTMTIAEG